MFYIINTKIFNYINYFTLSCIIPIGYFAPIGEWLILALIALTTIIDCFINKNIIDNWMKNIQSIIQKFLKT